MYKYLFMKSFYGKSPIAVHETIKQIVNDLNDAIIEEDACRKCAHDNTEERLYQDRVELV